MDINCFKTIFSIYGIYNIHKVRRFSKFRYFGIIELTVPKIARSSIVKILDEYNICYYINRNTIRIKSNSSIELFINTFCKNFLYRHDEIDILFKYVKHRLLSNRKRYDNNDEYYYQALKEIKTYDTSNTST